MILEKPRVVITGIGMISPVGTGTAVTWENLLAGRSGVGRITRFDPGAYDCQIAGEVHDFQPEQWIEKKELKKSDLFIQFAIAAAHMAWDDSGLAVGDADPERVGVVIGSGIGGLPAIEETHKKLLERGPGRISPFFIPSLIVNLAAGQVSIRLKAKGPNSAPATACATGAHAIGDSLEIIRRGAADVMIAGGAEAVITPLALGGFAAMRALSRRNDDPEHASRPWDAGRDGFIMGEGAGIVILEERGRAMRRGARIYAELVGYGMTADAYHITAPSDDGDGMKRVMSRAIEDAGLALEAIEYINAHGTSTPIGDRAETIAVKNLFGDHARALAISSTKSMTGHLLGAAGGLEAGITALAVQTGKIPPTINYQNPDPECDLDYVPNTMREKPLRHAMSNSFGFGGTNATLVFSRHEG
ncbi:MAG TPA: beta-ketoacyl-ACP synthase II [Thermoanaerobaculia bacterium]|nr:beta-ketoacyl-ACP synthase II [Thermoanaerobaculia bacterium]